MLAYADLTNNPFIADWNYNMNRHLSVVLNDMILINTCTELIYASAGVIIIVVLTDTSITHKNVSFPWIIRVITATRVKIETPASCCFMSGLLFKPPRSY